MLSDDQEHRLRLWRTERVGPVTYRYLLERFGSAQRALGKVGEISLRGGGRKPVKPLSKAAVRDEAARLEALGGCFVFEDEENYPDLLRTISDAPPVLSVLGHPHLLKRSMVAVVGARNASTLGLRLAHQLSEQVAAAGYVVISGLARGIDGAAHQGALSHGTVAVVAGGVDVVYPPEHQSLFEALCGQGAVLSDMPLGSKPQAGHFPRRNRLIAGAALGTLVVEAGLRSGSLITARLAAEQGREVFAVPGSPQDGRARGCNALLRDGAHFVESVEDILEVLESSVLRRDALEERESRVRMALREEELDTEDVRARLLESLTGTPVLLDEVIAALGFPARLVQAAVVELELAGKVERQPGNLLCRLEFD